MTLAWSTIDSFAGNFTSPALTFDRPCPVCGSIRSQTVFGFDGFQFYTDSASEPKRTDIRERLCRECFAVFLNPCYSQFGFQMLFAEAGMSYGSHTADRPGEQIGWLQARKLLPEGTTILDVGCYDGAFLARMPAGVHCVGVDIDAAAIERGRRELKEKRVEFVLGDFETFVYGGQVDLITMFHVLEHLPSPVRVLRKLRSVCHPESRLLVEVPVLENGITNDINGFLSVQHMTHFSRRSLKNCLALAGWDVAEWVEMPDYNGCRVLARPGAQVATVCGDANDMGHLQRYLAGWYQAVGSAGERLGAASAESSCVIWGGGAHTEFVYHVTPFFHSNPGRRYLIVDSDPLKQGRTWRGIPIADPSALREVDWSGNALIVSSYGSQATIVKAAGQLGVPSKRIITLYDGLRVY